MLYRLQPPALLTWSDLPGSTVELVRKHPGADLDRLPWEPTEERGLTLDLLRIAVRHGAATTEGIVLAAEHTALLGWAYELRARQRDVDQAQAKMYDSDVMKYLEQQFPGTIASGQQLDERVRASTDRVARERDEDLTEVLAAPAQVELVEHWRRLGGHYPD